MARRDWLCSPDATLHPVRKSSRRLQWRPEQGSTKAELLTVEVQQHSHPLTTQHKKRQHSASTWAWTELMVGGAAFSALLLTVDAEETYIAGGNGEALEEIGRSTRRVFNATCTSGSACCQVPPCRCGTYLYCIDKRCLTAKCDLCPEGFYCDCKAACALATGGGWDFIVGCPLGHYCPYGSGAPIPCPANFYSKKPNVAKESDCLPCAFPMTSGEGAAACSISIASLMIIIGAVAGFCVCLCLGAFLRRRLKRRRAAADQTFHDELHHEALREAVMGATYGGDESGDEDTDTASTLAAGGERVGVTGRAAAARQTAAEKKAALEKRMQELEEGTDKLLQSKAQKEHSMNVVVGKPVRVRARERRAENVEMSEQPAGRHSVPLQRIFQVKKEEPTHEEEVCV